MLKKKIKRGSLLYKLYLYYNLYIKEKCILKRKQYSQWGEDLVINDFFKNKTGKYVDIGCFHPIKHNNTCLLYNRGWTGINIDLNPASIDLFNIIRQNDLNISAALSDEKNKKVVVHFENYFSSLNSINSKHLDKLNLNYSKYEILTTTFKDIVKFNFDFLNIDCEGEDYNILKTINLKKYTPKLICIEIDPDDLNNKKIIYNFLQKYDYTMHSVHNYSHIFVKS